MHIQNKISMHSIASSSGIRAEGQRIANRSAEPRRERKRGTGTALSLSPLQSRNRNGSILILNLFALAILVALLLTLSNYISALLSYNHAQNAVQSSAVCAAQALSKVVVQDPSWGFVSLSDHPANGSITIVADGEALPVVGINTITNTVRLEKNLAQKLDLSELDASADEDYTTMHHASRLLQSELKAAVTQDCRHAQDINGKILNPYKEALELFRTNVPELRTGKAVIKNFKLSLGWLADGSETLTVNPDCDDAKKESANTQCKFDSFINYPSGGKDFYFAGLSEHPRLVNVSRFQMDDGKRFCSAVLVEAEIALLDPLKDQSKDAAAYTVKVRAVALPEAKNDDCAPGSLVIDFPQGTVSELPNLKAILSRQEFAHQDADTKQAVGGDFPEDPQARLESSSRLCSLSRFQSRAFCDWLRTTHGKVKLESLIAAINKPFTSSSSSVPSTYIFAVDAARDCQTIEILSSGNVKRTVSDRQSYQYNDRVLATSRGNLGVCIRDQVANPAGSLGGKHGGQPLPGELPKQIAWQSQAMNSPDSVGQVSSGMRRSYLEGGLAVCVELFLTNG